jgi:hypothetical protein
MKHIYLYSTQTYLSKSWYKIGEAVGNPNKRITQQDNASNPESLMPISFWIVNDSITDKKVHNALEKLGFIRLRKNREWFELSNIPEQDLEEAFLFLNEKAQKGFITDEEKRQNNESFKKVLQNIEIPHYSELWWSKSI